MPPYTYLPPQVAQAIRSALNSLNVEVGDTVPLNIMTQAFGVPNSSLLRACLTAIESMDLVRVNKANIPTTFTIGSAWVGLRDNKVS